MKEYMVTCQIIGTCTAYVKAENAEDARAKVKAGSADEADLGEWSIDVVGQAEINE